MLLLEKVAACVAAFGVLTTAAEAGCKIYSLSPSKPSVQVVAPMITNNGPGTIRITPPGSTLKANDLFLGNSNYRYRVTLVGQKSAKFEACN